MAGAYQDSSASQAKKWMTSDRRKYKQKQRDIDDAARINSCNEDITVHDDEDDEIFADDDGTTQNKL